MELAPGTYGALSVAGGSVLNLGAGEFDFSTIWLGQNTRLIADTSTGDVIINLTGSLSTSANVSVEKTGTGSVLFQGNGNMYLGTGNILNASFSSFKNGLSVDSNTTIDGRLYALGDIWLGKNTTIHAIDVVPEPVSGLLMIVAAVLVMRWSRRPCLQPVRPLSRLTCRLSRRPG